jgi:hypothetical protein
MTYTSTCILEGVYDQRGGGRGQSLCRLFWSYTCCYNPGMGWREADVWRATFFLQTIIQQYLLNVLTDNSIYRSSDLALKRQTDNAVSKAFRQPTIDSVDRLIRCRFVELSPIMPRCPYLSTLWSPIQKKTSWTKKSTVQFCTGMLFFLGHQQGRGARLQAPAHHEDPQGAEDS